MPKRKPQTLDGTIQDLYGHVTGLQKDISIIRDNHLKHMHEDIDKVDRKVDKIEAKTDNLLYWIIGGAFTTILSLTGLFNLFLQ
jgi:hypothetical protein|tara:strand:- start:1685 stop:1936 length:252 start_codon:yes stop_codon:yes gene_type:complete